MRLGYIFANLINLFLDPLDQVSNVGLGVWIPQNARHLIGKRHQDMFVPCWKGKDYAVTVEATTSRIKESNQAQPRQMIRQEHI